MKLKNILSGLCIGLMLAQPAWAKKATSESANTSTRVSQIANMSIEDKLDLRDLMVKIANVYMTKQVQNKPGIDSLIVSDSGKEALVYTLTMTVPKKRFDELQDAEANQLVRTAVRLMVMTSSCVKDAEGLEYMKALGWSRAQFVVNVNQQEFDSFDMPLTVCAKK